MQRRDRSVGRRTLLAILPALLLIQAFESASIFGQTTVEPVTGLEVDLDLLAEPWVDPIVQFELEDEPLGEVVGFELESLHPSDVFEDGVESLAVREEVDVALETEQHLRALQAVATAELALATAGQGIVDREQSIAVSNRRIGAARSEIGVLEDQIRDLEVEISGIVEAARLEQAEFERLSADIDLHQSAIAEFAIQAFIGADDALESIATDPLSLAPVTRRIITDEARDSQRDAIAGLEVLVGESEARSAVLAGELAVAEAATAWRRSSIDDLGQEIFDLQRDIADFGQQIADLQDREVVLEVTIEDTTAFTEVTAARYQVVYHQRLAEFVRGTDLPLVALNAYIRASRVLSEEDPGCGIHWSQLAGIGRIESLHGYFGESTLDPNGQTTTPIRGLALDGRVLSGPAESAPDASGRTQTSGNVSRLALILDTDDGVLDGDTKFDRAVGPMQFIPTTWRLYDDSDGDGNNSVDPQNVYDASLAAARYLCDAPGSMLTAEGEQRAYFAYNHDFAYSRNVTVAGRFYHGQLGVGAEISPSFAAYAASGAAEALAAANLAEANGEVVCDEDEAETEDQPVADAEAAENGDDATCSSSDESEGEDSLGDQVEPEAAEPVLAEVLSETTPANNGNE